MTTAGWVFFSLSMVFVWGLAIWSYWKTLTAPDAEED